LPVDRHHGVVGFGVHMACAATRHEWHPDIGDQPDLPRRRFAFQGQRAEAGLHGGSLCRVGHRLRGPRSRHLFADRGADGRGGLAGLELLPIGGEQGQPDCRRRLAGGRGTQRLAAAAALTSVGQPLKEVAERACILLAESIASSANTTSR
jgi:hypothetical protein